MSRRPKQFRQRPKPVGQIRLPKVGRLKVKLVVYLALAFIGCCVAIVGNRTWTWTGGMIHGWFSCLAVSTAFRLDAVLKFQNTPNQKRKVELRKG